MKRKTKKPAGRPEPFSGDRKLRGRIAGIPAILKSVVLDDQKDKAAENEEECSKSAQFQSATNNCVAQSEKRDARKLDDHSDDTTNGEDNDDTDDLDEFNDDRGDSEEEEQQTDEQKSKKEDSGNETSSDDEVTGEDDGKIDSDDSVDETEKSKVGNDHHGNVKLTIPSVCKNMTSKTSNDQMEVLAGEKHAGKSGLRNPVDETTISELEKEPLNSVKLSKPFLRSNNTGKRTNESVKEVAGKNGGKNMRLAIPTT